MKCPHCNHTFPLTWGRYLKSPLGKHHCPSCHKDSKLSLSMPYLAKSFLPIILLTAVTTKLVITFFSSTLLAALTTIFFSLLIGIPWDKYCDGNRDLKPLKKRNQN